MTMKIESDEEELNKAVALAEKINSMVERYATHWGIVSAALANVIGAAGYRSFEHNRAQGMKVIKAIFAASQTILRYYHDEAMSPKAQEAVRLLITENRTRVWAGNFDDQKALTDKILASVHGSKTLDVMGSLGTITANLICDVAKSEEQALAGLKAHFGDVERTVAERFADERKLKETPPAGHA